MNKHKINEFDTVFQRVCDAIGIKKYVELAKILGGKSSTISDARARNKFPEKWIHKIALIYGLDADYLLAGKSKEIKIKARLGGHVVKEKARPSDNSVINKFVGGAGMKEYYENRIADKDELIIMLKREINRLEAELEGLRGSKKNKAV